MVKFKKLEIGSLLKLKLIIEKVCFLRKENSI
jgi:hypothetical protein